MASVGFNGTIWSDSSTGVDRVGVFEATETQRTILEPIPRNGGYFAKLLGSEPGQIAISLTYLLSSAEVSSLRTTLNSKQLTTGTLTYPPGETRTNCRLMQSAMRKRETAQNPAGSIKYFYEVDLLFQPLRPAS